VTWVSWRQSRASALALVILVALLAAYLIPTGLSQRTAFDTGGLARCLLPADQQNHSCRTALADFYRISNGSGRMLVEYLRLVPAFLGVFLGAPLLARELEQGTHQLVWTQSITRTRWVTIRLLLAGLIALAGAQAVSMVITFWRAPLDQLTGRFDPGAYSLEGIVPTAYALFAFTVGTAAGVVIRRTVPAMAVTLGVYLAVRITLEDLARPRFLPAQTITYLDKPPAQTPSGSAGDWILDTQTPKPGLGLPTIVTYQPADRYWTFQLLEAGICIAAAAALIALTVHWTRRRVR